MFYGGRVMGKELTRPFISTANFFKHADRDADAILEFNELEEDTARVLSMACFDFERVTEGSTIKAWIYAQFPKVTAMPLGAQREIKICYQALSWHPPND